MLTGGLISGTYLVAFQWRDVLHLSVFPALFFAVAIYLMMRNIPAAAADAAPCVSTDRLSQPCCDGRRCCL